MSEVAALEGRVTRLETQISDGFERIENLLRTEINDLKTEQITDLRDANKRLADDQRRLWERLGDLERRENQRVGGHKALWDLGHLLSVVFGGLVTWLATWVASGKTPPHP